MRLEKNLSAAGMRTDDAVAVAVLLIVAVWVVDQGEVVEVSVLHLVLGAVFKSDGYLDKLWQRVALGHVPT